MTFKRGDLTSARVFQMHMFTNESEAQRMTDNNKSPGRTVSDYYFIDDFETSMGTSAEVEISIDDSTATNVKIYRANANSNNVFQELSTKTVNGRAVASTDEGGVFVASTPVVAVYIIVATIVFLLIVIIIAVAAVVIYFRVRPEKWKATKSKVSGGVTSIKRSFAKKV